MGIGQECQTLTGAARYNVSYWAIKYETPANEFRSHMRQRSAAGGAGWSPLAEGNVFPEKQCQHGGKYTTTSEMINELWRTAADI